MARVRLFAVLRELAGAPRMDVPGDSVQDVIVALTEKFGERFGQVARAGTVVVDGERASFDRPLAGDEEVALLPPVSGGALARRPERVLLVANPVARTVSRPMLEVIEKALAADFKLDVHETTGRGHATELARRAVADGFDLMVVFSGDGTINEAANGLAGSGVALGLIPGGATNVLARVLGIPNDPVEATAALLHAANEGRARRLHLGMGNGRYFAFACGAGLDAQAMADMERRPPDSKRSFEWTALRAVVKQALVRYAGRDPDLSVQVGEEAPIPAVSAMVGKANPYTFFKRWAVKLTPGATLEGGLDVLAVQRIRRLAAPRLAWQLLVSGSVARRPDMVYVHDVDAVLITGRRPFPVQMDGDFIGWMERLEVRLARDALTVLV